jgi:hypothetical protein
MASVPLLHDYMTREQLATELNKTVRTLDRWYMLREGPAVTRVGNRRLYHVDDVRAWLKARRLEMPAGKVA